MFNTNYKENLRPEEVIMYLRKSRQDDASLSVEEVLAKHEAILDEWVEKNLSAPIPAENRFKEIVSGGESIEERPEFQKVLKMVESPNYRAVLCVEISRLGRPDTMEIGRISKTFMCTNTIVITPSRAFNVADKYERDMFEQELRIGQYFLDYLKTIMRTGRDESAKRGCYLGSWPPFGYDKVTIMDGKRKLPTLAINEERANIVRMVFDAYVNENIGTQTIANRLNEMGVKPQRSKRWRVDSIIRMLENPHYTGRISWNEYKSVLVVDNGEFKKTRKKTKSDEYILRDGLHEAIISDELFNAAQAKRGRMHKACANRELRNPFASLIYCECGRGMSYRHSVHPDRKDRNVKEEPRLVCNGQKYCGNGSCHVSEITDFVVDLLRKRIADFEEEVRNERTDVAKFNENQVKVLEKKLSDLGDKELALWESQLDKENKMPPNVFQSLTEKLSKEREETEAALSKAREAVATPINNEVKRVTLQNALDALLDDEVSVAEKNRFLKMCIKRITYRRDTILRLTGHKGNGRGYVSPPIELDIKMMF